MDAKTIELPKQDHEYNNPKVSPKEFLLAIMHDRTVPMCMRIEAATMVAPFYTTPQATVKVHPTCIIKIPGLYQ
jgi:hypothetical protein